MNDMLHTVFSGNSKYKFLENAKGLIVTRDGSPSRCAGKAANVEGFTNRLMNMGIANHALL